MNELRLSDDVTAAGERVRRQRALVVMLAKAKRFEELPVAHQLLRQLEDALKLARLSQASSVSSAAAASQPGSASRPAGKALNTETQRVGLD